MSDSFTESVKNSAENSINEKYEKKLKRIELDDNEKFDIKEFNNWLTKRVEKLEKQKKADKINLSYLFE